MKRVATAMAIAPLFIAFVCYSSFPVFVAFVEVLAAVSFLEFSRMASAKGIAVFQIRGLVASLVLPLAFMASSPSIYTIVMLVVVSIILAGIGDAEAGVSRIAFTILGVFYIGMAFSAPALIRGLPDGEKLFLLVCFATWGADIGAYYCGRSFGRTKLAPRISPNKTVEGFAGGVASSLVFGWAFSALFYTDATIVTVLAAGVAGGLFGPLGDLCESLLKRYFGVKDSGAILPGHGGLLDRADALMFSSPFFYLFLAFKDGIF